MIPAISAWGPAATWAAVLFLLSELHGGSNLVWFALHDKLVHLALYGVMGITLAWGQRRSPLPGGRARHVLALLAGFAYGAADEWHQSFVPGRTPALDDFLADVVGVTAGYVVLFLIHRWLLRRRDRGKQA